MKFNRSVWTGAALTTAIFLLPAAGRADNVLDLQATITGVTYQYQAPNDFGFPGEAEELLTVSLPTISDVSLADYSSIEFDLAPAAGDELVISEPSTLSFYFDYAAGDGSASGPGCSSVDVTGTGGTPSNAYQLCLIASNSESLNYAVQENFPADYALTDLSMTMSTAGFPEAAAADFTFGDSESPDFVLSYSTNTDNGAFVTLTSSDESATPEPGTIMLLGASLLGLGALRFRKRSKG